MCQLWVSVENENKLDVEDERDERDEKDHAGDSNEDDVDEEDEGDDEGRGQWPRPPAAFGADSRRASRRSDVAQHKKKGVSSRKSIKKRFMETAVTDAPATGWPRRQSTTPYVEVC